MTKKPECEQAGAAVWAAAGVAAGARQATVVAVPRDRRSWGPYAVPVVATQQRSAQDQGQYVENGEAHALVLGLRQWQIRDVTQIQGLCI